MANTPYGEHVEGGGSLSLMTLADLIRSSATIHSSVNKKYGYSMAQAIQKQFGTIYYNNKVVVYNEQSRILEIRMGIGTKTEKAYKGMHSVRLAIYGVEGTIYNSLEELYRDKTGMIEDVEDMNKMTKALQGKGNSSLNKQMSDAERERNANLGNETNKFTLSYGPDPNAQLSGYVVPVAAVDPDTGAYTYNESGRIFYMENGIDVNSFVRVSCSCFTGDTNVILGDGSYVPLKDLVGKTNFEVLSYNQFSGKFEKATALSCELKKRNANLIKIILDDGNEIKVTPDHRFLLRSGEWKRADELQPQDSLRAFYGVNESGLYRKDGSRLSKVQKFSEEKRYYTYIYLDPTKNGEYNYGEISFNYEPIYVGKGTGGRSKEHLNLTKETNEFLKDRIIDLKNRGVEPLIIINHASLSEYDALAEEEYLINRIGTRESGGPLLNIKTIKGSKLSESGRQKISDRMKLSNPMKNPDIVARQKETFAKNGATERASNRMKLNNPMFNKETSQAVYAKYHERIGDMNAYMANLRNKVTHEGMREGARKRKEKDPYTYNSMIEGHKKDIAERIAKGTYHTQSDEFKAKISISSKENWKNPEYRKNVIEKSKLTRKYKMATDPEYRKRLKEHGKRVGAIAAEVYKKKCAENPEWATAIRLKTVKTRTINRMAKYIKEHGNFDPDNYKNIAGCYSVATLKERNWYDLYVEEATKRAYENHKVLKVEKIASDDVYCITVEGLPNFTIATPNVNPDIISGVVVHNCSSYYFTMGLYNFWAGAHLGQAPAPYPGKNPNSDTIMNETKSPGLCKHLMMLVMLLLDGGILSKIGTKGFSFNLQDIRNRTDKLQIPRKLADERDWANHARQLQRTLRNADKKHIAQFHDRQTAKEVYREYEKSGLARNSIEFNKFMSTKRAAGKDILYGNTPLSDFARDALDYMNSQDYQKDRLRRPKYNLDLFKHYK